MRTTNGYHKRPGRLPRRCVHLPAMGPTCSSRWGLIGTGMLGVPVLVGSCAYAVGGGSRVARLHGRQAERRRQVLRVMAVAMALGLVLNFAGLNAVKMLFWSAVINGLLAPPLILLVILLTSSHKVMGKSVNRRYSGT